MRRNDKEVTDAGLINDIISRCFCCRIGFNDDGQVYIVPLSFGFERKENTYVFYFHGAKEGRKIDLISKNPEVGFEMDTGYMLNEGTVACKYSARFQSIIGNGIVEFVSSSDEKAHGLSLIMEHSAGKGNWVFDHKMTDSVAVFKMTVTKMSCKQHH